jgi:hypothetical protein
LHCQPGQQLIPHPASSGGDEYGGDEQNDEKTSWPFDSIVDEEKTLVSSIKQMEPALTKAITNTTICNFLYAFFSIFAIIALFTVGGILAAFFTAKEKFTFFLASLPLFVSLAITLTMMLFYYRVCDKFLAPNGVVRGARESNPNMMA